MLFPYVFSPQTMDKMQEFIEYIFMHVWCAAAPDRPFQLSLFRGNAELYTIMEDIWQQIDIRKQSNAFWDQVEDIYQKYPDPLTKKLLIGIQSAIEEMGKGD